MANISSWNLAKFNPKENLLCNLLGLLCRKPGYKRSQLGCMPSLHFMRYALIDSGLRRFKLSIFKLKLPVPLFVYYFQNLRILQPLFMQVTPSQVLICDINWSILELVSLEFQVATSAACSDVYRYRRYSHQFKYDTRRDCENSLSSTIFSALMQSRVDVRVLINSLTLTDATNFRETNKYI